MPLIPLELPPGVSRNGTRLQSRGRWYDANLIRWRDGRMRPVGGWSKITTSALDGVGRSMFSWKSNAGQNFLAIGTGEKLYLYSASVGSSFDITPSGFVAGRATAVQGTGYGVGGFNGTAIQKTVTASDIAVGSSTTITSTSTDFTTIFSAPEDIQASGFSNSANNKTYPDFHHVTNVAANTLTISGTLTPEAAGSDITLSAARGFGESVGSSSLTLDATTWSFDSFGEFLVAVGTSDGKLYYWQPAQLGQQTAAAVVTGAPTGNLGVIVSKERIVICLGSGGNPKLVKWGDQEALVGTSVWTPAATNTAGSFELETAGSIMTAKKVGDRILIWTSQDCHALDWVGPPYIYGRSKIGEACGVISPQAAVSVRGIAAWISDGSFWMYDGVVKPLKSEVAAYIFDDINPTQTSQIYGVPNKEFNEIWWFYVSKSGTEIDKYVIWNYAENWWSIGQLPRTSMIDSGVYGYPIGLGTDGLLYQHEQKSSGTTRSDDAGVPTSFSNVGLQDRQLAQGTTTQNETAYVYAESGPFELGNGDRVMHAKQLITDTENVGSNGLRFRFKTRQTPAQTLSESQIYDLQADGYTDIREQGRELSLRVESPYDQDFDIGRVKMQVSPGGRR